VKIDGGGRVGRGGGLGRGRVGRGRMVI